MDTPTSTQIERCVSLYEYLHSSYDPDMDFVSGELQERNMGEFEHGAVQGALVRWFGQHRHDWKLRVIPELRLQTRVDRFRIPDIMLLDRSLPIEQIITHAPLVCIEVLSPEDRFGRMEGKIDEYLQMGVRKVWVIDPYQATGWDCPAGSLSTWQPATRFSVPETQITLDLPELFADLD